MLKTIAKVFPFLTQVRVEQIDLDYAIVHMFITSIFGQDVNEEHWLIEDPANDYVPTCLPVGYYEELEHFLSMP